ncbi:MAG: outer membrane beta-barrel family protein, partial [Flavobacteriaceae bacterium]|nr:outer membrane beta-barrel family protein [Flavobacteriaceae bacterium]
YLSADNYFFQVSFVGFEEYAQAFTLTQDLNLATITLKEDAAILDEVEITVKRPVIKKELDKIIFDVENTILSSGSTYDILKRAPGVISESGSLRIRNTPAVIYINGRRVNLSNDELNDLLQSYSGQNVKQVEVIMNPSAKYDAESGAILNIITSKNITPGYKGSVEATATYAVFPKYSLGTSHYYKTDKLNVFFNYVYNNRKEDKKDNEHINFKDALNNDFSRWNTNFRRITDVETHSANLILDYEIDAKNSLNFTSNILLTPDRMFNNNALTEMRNASMQLDSSFTTTSGLDEELNNLAFDLTHTAQIGEKGTKLTTNAHYTNYENDRDQNIATNYFFPNGTTFRTNSFFTDAFQDIEIFTAQTDLEFNIKNYGFEAGLKYSNINSSSGLDFFDTNAQPTFIQQFSDDFDYDEEIFAGYVSVSRSWEKWYAKAGIRGEQTDAEGVSNTLSETNRLDFFEVFPSAFLQYNAHENHSFSVDYSRKITRPRYSDLNPFAYFVNENNFQLGNPTLVPAIGYKINFNYTLLGQYSFDFYYRNTDDYITTLAFQDNQNFNMRTVTANAVESEGYGIDFTHGRSITNWWYFYTYSSLFFEEETFIAQESNDVIVSNNTTGFYGQFYNAIYLSKNRSLAAEVTLTYLSSFVNGSYDISSSTDLVIGIRKSLWDNRAVLTLAGEDLLGSANARSTSRYLNQDNGFFSKPETRFFRIGFKYNFGNFRLK